MLVRALALMVVVSVSLFWSFGAAADGRSKDPPGYAEAVTQGVSELEAGNYPEAREEFMRAHQIFANARTQRGLGMVEFELRNYVDCVRWLKEALSSSTRPLDGKMRADTETLLVRAQRYLGELRLEIKPSGAIVTIDGQRARLEREGSFLLEVGQHTLEVSAPGHAPEKRSIRVQGGSSEELRIALSSAQDAPAESVARKPEALNLKGSSAPPSEVQPTYKKWWLWTTVCVLVAGGATAAALLLTRDKQRTTTEAVQTDNAAGPILQTLGSF